MFPNTKESFSTAITLLLLAFSLAGGAERAYAAAATCTSTNCSATVTHTGDAIYLQAYLSKTSYAPGEHMILYAYAYDNLANPYPSSGASPITYYAINATSPLSANMFAGPYAPATLDNGVTVSVDIGPAPSSSGYIYVYLSAGGYTNANGTFPFTVVATGCAYGTNSSGTALDTTSLSSINYAPADRRVVSGGMYKSGEFGNYCYGNSGGPTYFVPLGSWAEFSTFWNAISRLSGLYTIP